MRATCDVMQSLFNTCEAVENVTVHVHFSIGDNIKDNKIKNTLNVFEVNIYIYFGETKNR